MRALNEIMTSQATCAVPTDTTSPRAIEMIVMWNDSARLVRHYRPSEKGQDFTIGEDFSCDFAVPAELLGGRDRVVLMERAPGKKATVPADPTTDQRRELSNGERCRIEIGPFAFIVSDVADTAPFTAPIHLSLAAQRFVAASLVFHAIFMGIIFMIPPDPEGMSVSGEEKRMRFIQAMLNSGEVKMQKLPDLLKQNAEPKAEDTVGKRAKDSEGQAGKTGMPETHKKYGLIGPSTNRDIRMQRDRAKEMARTGGIFSVWKQVEAPSSPFGSENPLGADPENALGALMGDSIGTNGGYGGLYVRGTGKGGGGTGEGTIGVNNFWGKIGHDGLKDGSGGPRGRPADLGPRRSSGPDVRVRTGAVVKGALSPELIRRVVQRHINEVKFCYEKQLVSRPDLEGRVTVRFMISGSGAVQMSGVQDSSLGNVAVEQCITSAVRRWSFPPPEGGGVVFVTYPFQLTNSGN